MISWCGLIHIQHPEAPPDSPWDIRCRFVWNRGWCASCCGLDPSFLQRGFRQMPFARQGTGMFFQGGLAYHGCELAHIDGRRPSNPLLAMPTMSIQVHFTYWCCRCHAVWIPASRNSNGSESALVTRSPQNHTPQPLRPWG